MSDLPGGGLQSIHTSRGAVRSRRYARRPGGSRARRSHLHAVEAALGHASRVGAGVRGLLRHEEVVACRQPRAPRRDPLFGGLAGLSAAHSGWISLTGSSPASRLTRRFEALVSLGREPKEPQQSFLIGTSESKRTISQPSPKRYRACSRRSIHWHGSGIA